jgi:hypothetical protein
MMRPPRLSHQWLTIAEVATEYNRSEQRVREWCRDGTLRAFGFLVMRSESGQWWIYNPDVSRNP